MTDKKQQSDPPLKLQLKLRADTSEAERNAIFRVARETGASNIRPLFPEAPDDELASLYIVEVDKDTAIPELMKAVEAQKAVEFIESEVRRKLKHR